MTANSSNKEARCWNTGPEHEHLGEESMFKKKRNALREEMRDIVRSDVPVVLHGLGLVTPRVTVVTSAGSKSTYDVKPVEDHAARALAKDAMVTAQEALKTAGVAQAEVIGGDKWVRGIANEEIDRALESRRAAMKQSIQESKRERSGALAETQSAASGSLYAVRPDRVTHARAAIPLREVLRRLEAGAGPLSVEFVDLPLHENGELDTGVDRPNCVADDLPLVPDCFKEFRVVGVVDVELSELSRAAGQVRCGDVPDDESELVRAARCDHCSSPVVAESEADTSDAPAMTVQEGGGSDAAPGVGWATVVRTTPRFVAIGEYVYDRELDRASDASNYIGGAPMIVERLLAGHFDANTLFEEDAK